MCFSEDIKIYVYSKIWFSWLSVCVHRTSCRAARWQIDRHRTGRVRKNHYILSKKTQLLLNTLYEVLFWHNSKFSFFPCRPQNACYWSPPWLPAHVLACNYIFVSNCLNVVFFALAHKTAWYFFHHKYILIMNKWR